MTDLAAWLLEQITENARCIDRDVSLCESFTPFGPDDLLAECAAKRLRIAELSLFMEAFDCYEQGPGIAMAERLMKLEALPYADRAGYREEWRP